MGELGHGPLPGGGAGDEEQVAPGGHELLLGAEEFAEAAFGAIALHGGANGGGGGDDADAGIRWRRAGRAEFPPDGEGAAVDAAALLAHGADVALAAQVLLSAEAHGTGRETPALAAPATRRSDDSQAFATLETAGTDDFTAAFGGHAGAITDLAGALFAVWAECGLHDVERKRGS